MPNILPQPIISIVIVAHNSGPLLLSCVQAALSSTLPVDVIVVDNASADGCVDALEKMCGDDSRLSVIRMGTNLGFAAACNIPLADIASQFVLFLNPDCIVQPGTLASMLEEMRMQPQAGMAGCLILNRDGSEQHGCRREIPTPRRLLKKLVSFSASGEGALLPKKTRGIEAISGAFMLVRRDALAQVGSFDEGYFMHWEDLDLCLRFRHAGQDIVFVPNIEVVHVKGESSKGVPYRVEWYKHAGLIRFLRKHYFSAWPLPLFVPIVVVISARFAMRAVILSIERLGRRKVS